MNDVILEDDASRSLLKVLFNDQSFCDVILRSKSGESRINMTDGQIDAIKEMLAVWKKRKIVIPESYLSDKRNPYFFLYDAVALAYYVSAQPRDTKTLFKSVHDGTALMHNRIIAQILYEYQRLRCAIDPNPTNFVKGRKHDFNVKGLRGEVKTILTLGQIERKPSGEYRFTKKCRDSIVNSLRGDFADAQDQVGSDGIIVVAPWSYKIMALLRGYYGENIPTIPPIPKANTTLLVLPSSHAFSDHYIAFQTDKFLSDFEQVLSNIDQNGVKSIMVSLMRAGLPPSGFGYMNYEVDFIGD